MLDLMGHASIVGLEDLGRMRGLREAGMKEELARDPETYGPRAVLQAMVRKR